MAYAMIDETGRIIEWSEDHLDGLDVEFSNGDYIEENCINGIDDFIIKDGVAVYSPLPNKEIETLKRLLSDTDYISAKMSDEMMLCTSVEEMMLVTKSFVESYGDVIEQRKKWREKINELESSL